MTTLREKITKADVGEKIYFPENKHYKFVEFDFRNYGEEYDEYCWTIHNFGWGYEFPHGKSWNIVGTFKTLNGAKRNLIKRISHYFDLDAELEASSTEEDA